MSSTNYKWIRNTIIGCGIVAVLAVAAVIAGGYFFVRNTVDRAKQIDAVQDEVSARFGAPADFRPDPSGIIPADRVEAFLAAREVAGPARSRLEESLQHLSMVERGEGGPLDQLAAFRSGMDLIPGIMDFITARSQGLLDGGIGPGEYLFIYTLVYCCWLGRSPADGPPFQLTGDNNGSRHQDEQWVRDARLERNLAGINAGLLPVLRNQMQDARATGTLLARALEEEVAAMEADHLRLPWAEGLPEPTQSSLEPHRDRLLASYSEMCNALELAADPEFHGDGHGE